MVLICLDLTKMCDIRRSPYMYIEIKKKPICILILIRTTHLAIYGRRVSC